MKHKKWFGLLILLIAFGGSITAFQKVTKADLRAEKLDKRLTDYQRILEEKCLERVFEDASAIVDSMMIERARANRDTIDKPPKPERPERPDIIDPTDTSSVVPLNVPIDSTQ